MNQGTRIWLNVIVGFLLLLGIGWFVMNLPCPTSTAYIFFRVVLALAVACLSAILMGTINIENNAIKAGGAFAVFLLVLKFTPQLIDTRNKCNGTEFDFSIHLRDKDNMEVEGLKGNVSLLIDNQLRQERAIDENGRVFFENIPINYTDSTANAAIVELKNVEGYLFKANHKKALNIHITGKSMILIVEEDESRCCVSGIVRDQGNNALLKDAKITLTENNQTVMSDENGYFKLAIPKTLRGKTLVINISKPGYESQPQDVSVIIGNYDINLTRIAK